MFTFAVEDVTQTFSDLWCASTENIKSVILWFILYMLHHRDTHEKVRREIETFVEHGSLPTVEVQSRLVYTQATIHEVLRITNTAPLTTYHTALTDTTIRGYHIPKGSSIMGSLYACHMSEEKWGDPHVFRPERFISDSGALSIPSYFMPFGKGLRSCIGGKMAMSEIYLVVTSLIHNFDIDQSNNDLPSKEGIPGITLSPQPFSVSCSPLTPCDAHNIDFNFFI